MTAVHALWRGLIVTYLYYWVFSGPQDRDVEHISSTLLHVYINVRARDGED